VDNRQPTRSDPFAVLGLARRYDVDRAELEQRYRALQRALHPDRHTGGTASQRRLSLARAVEVNEAYRTLKDDLARAEALLALQGGSASAADTASDPEFLMEMMELREALGDAKAEGDLARVRALAERVQAMRELAASELAAGFAVVEQQAAREGLDAVAGALSRLRFLARFLDEVSVIEEEALG
jgi:molecular chaperone HscB